ncbi:preprotein translocase subunit YajC [Solidesulfovibrio sp.]|jgi:preprotein translocase subunit YajC|uniref:preprotein translocase subunit YajC n=1 Tax=Solidesulfovibrio sp. TaxID=2910990 RepID=UPI000EBABACA|nr:preprotein translocase subunit YajC [Solidesulfovibrio sp.]MEA5089956.1 preprotein translocase subunit YajC [Solidesulfovibrio sp.]HCR13528.1 preprotein translocase subunit YajC [Desulfovibrio sp.]HML61557.1 preprotein translocase subunit YajC [Solidesulfovibrio sp.]
MFFPSLAHAMGAAPAGGEAGGNPITAFLPLILMFAIFYFLLIRPQQKKAKQHKEYLSSLKRGDYILSGGGIYGRIMEVHGDKLTVEIAKDLNIEINRNYVSGPGDAAAAPAKAEPKAKAKEKE